MKIGRLDSGFFMSVFCKIGNQNYRIADLAQIAPKNVSTCILNPYNTDHNEDIFKALLTSDLGL